MNNDIQGKFQPDQPFFGCSGFIVPLYSLTYTRHIERNSFNPKLHCIVQNVVWSGTPAWTILRT